MLFTLSLIFGAVFLQGAAATPANVVPTAVPTLVQRDCSHDNCLRGCCSSILSGCDSQY